MKIISKSKILSRFFGFLNRFSKATSLDAKSGPWWREGLGNLVISIRSGITGKEIKNIIFSPEEVSNATDWLMFDFSDAPIKNANGKVYAIVCYTDKGDETHNYYKWGYGINDPYKKGYMYISNDGTKWSYQQDKDFCFISYGKNKTKPNDEKPDGVTRRWAIIVYLHSNDEVGEGAYHSAQKMREVLEERGNFTVWVFELQQDSAKITKTMKELDKKEDADDIVFLMYVGHTSQPFSNYYVDQFGSERIILVYDCCYAEGQGKNLRKEGREILCSSRGDEESYEILFGSTPYGIFSYYLSLAFNGCYPPVSAEDAFKWAAPKTTTLSPNHQHPVMYDDYPGEIPVIP